MSTPRRHFRVPAALPARFVFSSHEASGTVADVSLEGLSCVIPASAGGETLRILKALAADPVVHVETSLGGVPVALPGRVSWTRVAVDSSDVLAGLRLEVDGPSQRVLRAWLLRGLAALRGAARHALHDEWQDACDELSALGIADATAPLVGAVLRYAAANGFTSTGRA